MQPHILHVLEALSQGVKQPGFEDNHLATHCAEVKTAWSCTSTSRHVAQLSIMKMIFTFTGHQNIGDCVHVNSTETVLWTVILHSLVDG